MVDEKAAEPPGPGLSLAALVVATSTDAATITNLVASGLIQGPGGAGYFPRGDVTRIQLIKALLRSGIALESLAAAVAAGRLSFDFAGDVVADPPGLTAADHATSLAALGLDAALVERLQLVLGLPLSTGASPLREDDQELYAIVAAARREGISDEATVRIFRSFSVAIRGIVAAKRDFFREAVEAPLLASGISRLELLQQVAPRRLALQRMGYRAIFLLLRRLLEEAVFENVILRLEEALDEAGVERPRGTPETTIAFADLSGFTRLTLERGDAAAAEQSAQFIALVQDTAARAGGRLIKPLGDGVMLHFKVAGEAVDCLFELITAAPQAGLPRVRAGIASGPLVSRDGDYFGHTVTLAARLADAASPGEIWTTPAVAEAARRAALVFEARPPQALKGLSDAVPIRVATVDQP